MVWYYAESGTQRGPVSEAEFEQLIADSRIDQSTLIWKDGMNEWQSLGSVRGASSVELPENQAQPDVEIQQSGQGAEALGSRPAVNTCAQCGDTFDDSELIRLGNIAVCTRCKPALLERLTAGSAFGLKAATAYGGFWIRAVAKSLDHILYALLNVIVISSFYDLSWLEPIALKPENLERLQREVMPVLLGMMLFATIYNAVMVGAFQGTLGKLIVKLRVVKADGSRVGYGLASARAILPAFLQLAGFADQTLGTIASVVLMVGYLMAASDPEKRTLFDRLLGTRVVTVS